MTRQPNILVLSHDLAEAAQFHATLRSDYLVMIAKSVDEAEKALEKECVEILVCDKRMALNGGGAFIASIATLSPETIIVLSGLAAEDLDGPELCAAADLTVIHGAPEATVKQTMAAAARLQTLKRDNTLLSLQLKLNDGGRAIAVGNGVGPAMVRRPGDCDRMVRATGSPMEEICDQLQQVAPFDLPILITGESGTGKELAARGVHENSLRWNKPFIAENCASLTDTILESELFGHKRGAFTDAVTDHKGIFERADSGTIFLDEVGDISPALQAKLLRVLQNGEIRPVGSEKLKTVDVRVIAATNKDVEAEVRAGRFREDLYYRLAGMTIELPPLRERRMDIAVIARALLKQAEDAFDKPVRGLSDATAEALTLYDWPGNVRELENEIRHMLVMARQGTRLTPDLISPRIRDAVTNKMREPASYGPAGLEGGTLRDRVEALEAAVLRETLERLGWNKSRAARELGLSRIGLRAKLKRYGIEEEGVASSEGPPPFAGSDFAGTDGADARPR